MSVCVCCCVSVCLSSCLSWCVSLHRPLVWLTLGINLPYVAFLACVDCNIRPWFLLGTGDANVGFKFYRKKATQAWADSHVSVCNVCLGVCVHDVTARYL